MSTNDNSITFHESGPPDSRRGPAPGSGRWWQFVAALKEHPGE